MQKCPDGMFYPLYLFRQYAGLLVGLAGTPMTLFYQHQELLPPTKCFWAGAVMMLVALALHETRPSKTAINIYVPERRGGPMPKGTEVQEVVELEPKKRK